MNIKIKVTSIDYHRNGVGGAPFYVVLFTDKESDGNTMLGIVFEEPYRVAVLDTAKLAAGDIAFGSNSWRGDRYEPALREVIKESDPEFSK